MRTVLATILLSSLWAILPNALSAQSLRESLKDIETADHWIYDDLPRAVAEAKETGKPLMVVLRCVPCPPGRTLDIAVMQPDRELESVEKQFVCVRVIKTNGLDLSVFQYDYDMSWNAMFLNSDMTIYGRYGTRTTSGPQSDGWLSAEGFKAAAQRALALHKLYPGNRDSLVAKTGKTPEYGRPELTPGLTDRTAVVTDRKQCIHCHMVKEFAMRAKWEAGRLSAEDLYVFPMPDQIGMTMSSTDGVYVDSVADGSPAEQAGIKTGDQVLTLDGQPIISLADIQWVLHKAPHEIQLAANVRRGDRIVRTTISLAGDWKKSDIAWRASSWYALRQGVKFEPMAAGEKRERGIGENQLALVIKGLYGNGGPKVREAGLNMNDVIIGVDGKSANMTESDFLAHLRLAHGPDDFVRFTTLRGKEKRELTIPMW